MWFNSCDLLIKARRMAGLLTIPSVVKHRTRTDLISYIYIYKYIISTQGTCNNLFVLLATTRKPKRHLQKCYQLHKLHHFLYVQYAITVISWLKSMPFTMRHKEQCAQFFNYKQDRHWKAEIPRPLEIHKSQHGYPLRQPITDLPTFDKFDFSNISWKETEKWRNPFQVELL